MLVSDALTYERDALATPGGVNTRWTNEQLIRFTDRAVKELVGSVLFPESRLVLSPGTIANQQEYVLPPMHVIYRVYVNGQRIVDTPGNISTLEGSQFLLDDQTAQGVAVAGTGFVPGAGGQAQPAWSVATPVAYPYLNGWGEIAPTTQPWATGQRPRFYRRGGSIGIVPAIGAANQSLVIEGVLIPKTLTQPTDTIIVPENFLEAIVSWVCYRAWRANKDEMAVAMSDRALADFQNAEKKLKTWRRQFSQDDADTFPITLRRYYAYGNNRTGSFW